MGSAEITWDGTGERTYEAGANQGVLYPRAADGDYDAGGVAWNGLVTVTRSPSGAEATPVYADNIKYLNISSAEEFSFTIEALTYPREFEECDGSAEVRPGVLIGQQNRKTFGFSYKTLIGNDVDGLDHGYKLHLVYGALAAPSEHEDGTLNESSEPGNFSWECSTSPEAVGTVDGKSYRPTAKITIDSTRTDPAALSDLEDVLYGRGAELVARLPLPAEVFTLIPAAVTP